MSDEDAVNLDHTCYVLSIDKNPEAALELSFKTQDCYNTTVYTTDSVNAVIEKTMRLLSRVYAFGFQYVNANRNTWFSPSVSAPIDQNNSSLVLRYARVPDNGRLDDQGRNYNYYDPPFKMYCLANSYPTTNTSHVGKRQRLHLISKRTKNITAYNTIGLIVPSVKSFNGDVSVLDEAMNHIMGEVEMPEEFGVRIAQTVRDAMIWRVDIDHAVNKVMSDPIIEAAMRLNPNSWRTNKLGVRDTIEKLNANYIDCAHRGQLKHVTLKRKVEPHKSTHQIYRLREEEFTITNSFSYIPALCALPIRELLNIIEDDELFSGLMTPATPDSFDTNGLGSEVVDSNLWTLRHLIEVQKMKFRQLEDLFPSMYEDISPFQLFFLSKLQVDQDSTPISLFGDIYKDADISYSVDNTSGDIRNKDDLTTVENLLGQIDPVVASLDEAYLIRSRIAKTTDDFQASLEEAKDSVHYLAEALIQFNSQMGNLRRLKNQVSSFLLSQGGVLDPKIRTDIMKHLNVFEDVSTISDNADSLSQCESVFQSLLGDNDKQNQL